MLLKQAAGTCLRRHSRAGFINTAYFQASPRRAALRNCRTATGSGGNGVDAENTSIEPSEKSIEEQYSKKSPLEHVLLRPGMYVGPTGNLPPTSCFVLNPTPEPFDFAKSTTTTNAPSNETTSSPRPISESHEIVTKDISAIPALLKIFDEILVNASDNRLRNPDSCTKLDVLIDPGDDDREPRIRIWNNGKGIPVEIHKGEKMYVPEMLFGHLLTGSNFDDNEKRLTGGRHGYGAKLTNIFSTSFTVETADSSKKLRYKQHWSNNMTQSSEPIITELPDGEEDYTCVSFVPDLKRLADDPNCVTIPDEDYSLMCRRVVDASGCANGALQVYLNGEEVSLDAFSDYSNMYRQQNSQPTLYHTVNSRLTIGVGLSDTHSFDTVSFVNGMSTSRGGTHVNALVAQIVKTIQKKVTKIEPDLSATLSTSLIKRNLYLACNALVENPTFDSQMKECLTSSPTTFGSSFSLSRGFLASIAEEIESGGPGIIEEVINAAKGRQQANLLKNVGGKKSRRQLLAIPKLDDAHSAGSSDSMDCTLILTEGDSAKALAVAGLEVIGREQYGVFPLRGKLLNVRHAPVEKLTKNKEVKALVAILGLDFDKEYDTLEELESLRYGHVMVMTDQDTDGSHIKGLVINFFYHFWPNLIKPPIDCLERTPFLSSFQTPLLKATSKKNKQKMSFYSVAQYRKWWDDLEDADKGGWSIKYYKGLGTSTPAEAKEYFAEFSKHYRPFAWESEQDGEHLDKVFDKERASDRREWLSNDFDPSATLDYDPDGDKYVSYRDFINKEMIHFSHADNIRSIPSAIDGLKPSQRKVLFACFKRKLKNEMKVAQLSGYCAEHTAYHHGEASLQGTIVGMAQDFVGSNNVNLLTPSGQFGTRLVGGKDAASPRYIFTHLSPVARLLFPEDDDVLLDYREDDGQIIEPVFFCPVIPLVLINGSQGIGSGWSTFIPPHSPSSVIDYVRAKIDDLPDLPSIEPFANGFTGKIERDEHNLKYTSFGRVKQLDNKSVLIDELPVGVWTTNYKSKLLKMQSNGAIADFVENHTTSKVSFRVHLKPTQMAKMKNSGLEKAFKLASSLPLTNMNAFDETEKMQKFNSPEDFADAHFLVRQALYHRRKSMIESRIHYSTAKLRNKAKFIQLVSDGGIDFLGGKLSRADTSELLHQFDFQTAEQLDNILLQQTDGRSEERSDKDFDYLLKMPLSSLNRERMVELAADATKTEAQLKGIQQAKPEDLWLADLDNLAKYV